MSGEQGKGTIDDVRAETATVAWQFGAQVVLVIAASPWHGLTIEASGRRTKGRHAHIGTEALEVRPCGATGGDD